MLERCMTYLEDLDIEVPGASWKRQKILYADDDRLDALRKNKYLLLSYHIISALVISYHIILFPYVLFCAILADSNLLYSILILFCSILFRSILFYSILYLSSTLAIRSINAALDWSHWCLIHWQPQQKNGRPHSTNLPHLNLHDNDNTMVTSSQQPTLINIAVTSMQLFLGTLFDGIHPHSNMFQHSLSSVALDIVLGAFKALHGRPVAVIACQHEMSLLVSSQRMFLRQSE